MKARIISFILMIGTLINVAHAKPVMLRNEYGKQIEYKTNLGSGKLGNGQIDLGELNSLTSLSIGLSSQTKYLKELQSEQGRPQNQDRSPLLVVLPTDPKKPLSWNIAWDWMTSAQLNPDVSWQKQQPISPNRPNESKQVWLRNNTGSTLEIKATRNNKQNTPYGRYDKGETIPLYTQGESNFASLNVTATDPGTNLTYSIDLADFTNTTISRLLADQRYQKAIINKGPKYSDVSVSYQ